ncbi:MAG TPA: FAD-dependent oxidoreductase [bacterium]|nr:FAD-dependent oxidoreductase [bacterium]
MPERDRGYEVAVLGAGCVGAAVAYVLARRRLASVVVDASRPDTDIPWPAAVAVQGGSVPDVRLALRSAERLPGLQDAVGPFGYRRTGGLIVALTEAEADVHRGRVSEAQDAGLPVTWLSREEALRREPGLSEGVLGARYCGYDGVVDGPALMRRLLAAAGRFGAVAHVGCGYVMIGRGPDGFRIQAGRDEIIARRLVLASGEMLRAVGRQIGVDLPLRTGRRRMCVTERVGPLLRHTVNGIHQMPSGEAVLDPPVALEEGAGAADVSEVVESLRRIATASVRAVPALATARILHAPLRVSLEPADGRPAVGRLEDRVHVAIAGPEQARTHFPIIADAIAEVLARDRQPEDLETWAPDRFTAAELGAGVEGEDSC